jgi:RNA polymerase sigma factor (sigma-70 family)
MSPTLSARVAHLADPPTDFDLLARYAAGRDGRDFAELVRRHGPMVLAVCRRVTAHAHDAEDAFQAAFLVLARKAGRLGPGDAVAGWLYGVAVRAARKAATRAWRGGRETLVASVPEVPAPAAEPSDPESAAVVLEAVGSLPDHLRAAVVLCELEGRSRAVAARELGIAEGTLSSRLASARKRLAAQLATRGYGPATLTVLAGVAVPPELSSAASALATGVPAPAAVVALTHGVRRAMMAQRFRYAPLVLGVVGAAALVAGLVTGQPPALPAGRAVDAPLAQPDPGRLYIWRRGEVIGLDPKGGNETPALTGRTGVVLGGFAVSPDGKRAAFLQQRDRTTRLLVRDVGPDVPATSLGEAGESDTFAWSGDGTELAVCRFVDGEKKRTATVIIDVATKARTPVALPDGHTLLDWSRDGRSFLTARQQPGDRPNTVLVELWLMNRDGSAGRRLGDEKVGPFHGRFSPDGRRVLAMAEGGGQDGAPRLVVLDLATGAATWVRGTGRAAHTFCWSPDGRRVAYTWASHDPADPALSDTEIGYYLTVCDPDGGNPRTVLSATSQEGNRVGLYGVDWR